MHIMGWPAVVLSGRQAGGGGGGGVGWQSGCRAVWTWGRGQREWSSHEYYGMMAAVGGGGWGSSGFEVWREQ